MRATITIELEGETRSLGAYAEQSALNAVLFDFNPAADDRVTIIKVLHAVLIQEMKHIQAGGDPAKASAAAIAITELEGTQMRAVKALFAKA